MRADIVSTSSSHITSPASFRIRSSVRTSSSNRFWSWNTAAPSPIVRHNVTTTATTSARIGDCQNPLCRLRCMPTPTLRWTDRSPLVLRMERGEPETVLRFVAELPGDLTPEGGSSATKVAVNPSERALDDETLIRALKLQRVPSVRLTDIEARFGVGGRQLRAARGRLAEQARWTDEDLVLAALREGEWQTTDDLLEWVDWLDHRREDWAWLAGVLASRVAAGEIAVDGDRWRLVGEWP